MKLRFFALAAIMLFSFSAARCELFWKVQSKSSTVYLLGSIHVGNENMYPLAPKLDSAFLGADYLCVEINTNNVDPGEVLKAGLLPAGKTLADILPDSVFKKYKSYFEKHNIPAMAYMSFKPWYAALMISNLEMSETGVTADFGVDVHYLKYADSLKKEILEVETIASQMKLLSVFDSIPNEFLDMQLDKSGEAASLVDSLVIAWKTGNEKVILRLLNEAEDKDPKVSEMWNEMIHKRNATMTAKIEEWLATDKVYFVIVGSAHLLGEDGIAARLKNANYKVSRIY